MIINYLCDIIIAENVITHVAQYNMQTNNTAKKG